MLPSPDHRLLAYSIDLEGDENFTTYVKDLETGALLPDQVANTYYSLEWANDNRTFFYTMLDEAMRPFQVWRHELGASEDTLVYQEDDGRFSVSAREDVAAGDSTCLSTLEPADRRNALSGREQAARMHFGAASAAARRGV